MEFSRKTIRILPLLPLISVKRYSVIFFASKKLKKIDLFFLFRSISPRKVFISLLCKTPRHFFSFLVFVFLILNLPSHSQPAKQLRSSLLLEDGLDDFTLWENKNGVPVIAGVQYQSGKLLFLSLTEQGFIGKIEGRYFSEPELKTEILKRKENSIFFPYGGDSFSEDYKGDSFGARWTGTIKPEYSEKYKFTTKTDDGVRLWVDGKQIINQWKDMGATDFSAELELSSGKEYSFKMEYYDKGGDAYAELSWESLSTPKSVIREVGSYDVGYHFQNPFGLETEWESNYFQGKEFQNKIGNKKETFLNFTSNTEPFAKGIPLENFCARFSSSIKIPVTGEYRFTVTSDDGVRLKLKGQNKIDQWIGMAPTEFSESLSFIEGENVPIEVEYFQGGGGKYLRLEWEGPGFSKTLLGPKGKKFRNKETPSLGLYPGKIFSKDLNEDGKNDLVVLHTAYNGKMSILLQNQFNSLNPPIEVRLGKDPEDILDSDLDFDLDRDILVKSKSEPLFYSVWNQGNVWIAEPSPKWIEPIQSISILPSYGKENPNESPYIGIAGKNGSYAKIRKSKNKGWGNFESLSAQEIKDWKQKQNDSTEGKKCIPLGKKDLCYDKRTKEFQEFTE
ncbi:hypothetical protein EHS15_04325 [Leptospira idonii]|uniref:PA14 domain-containing protein n=1 Tax=Leptospira idonii TaxID=1193500 RepID=A0A4R9M163_9LEPT|nr:hypothetical protein EHS15_04325 [Leptospira idonii]